MGYGDPPWHFTGKAFYQLQLVKADVARKYVPEKLKLVEAFGYTLGGFYLARYDDSPVGSFDELVVMGGLVWNPPTSCAWAARVYVTNQEAKSHGISVCGLPSRTATFKERNDSKLTDTTGWWQSSKVSQQPSTQGVNRPVELWSRALNRWWWPFGQQTTLIELKLPDGPQKGWLGPRLKLELPSFSGMTPKHPDMLRYACSLQTNVQCTRAARVTFPDAQDTDGRQDTSEGDGLQSLLGGKPVAAFAFNNMVMDVEMPVVVT